MKSASKLPTVAIAVFVVLSAIATPALAGGDGGLGSDAETSLSGDGVDTSDATGDDGVVDEGTDTVTDTTDDTTDSTEDTVDDTSGGATDSTTDTVDETTDSTTATVEDTVDDTTDTVDDTLDTDTSGTDDVTDGVSTTTSTDGTTYTASTASTGSGSVDSSASIHDWPTVGSDATHDGRNPDTTGPRVSLGSDWVAGLSDVSGTPVVANDTVYAVNETGTVVALARDGSVRWTTDVSANLLSGTPTVRGSPSVDDGTVYVTGTGTDAGYVFALDATDGSQRFSEQVGASTRSSPVAADGVVYVGSAATGTLATEQVGPLTAVYANGTQQWTNTNLDGEIAAAPAVTDSFVYAATVQGTLYKVDRTSGTVVDSVGLTGSSILGAPTVVNDTVYVAANDSTVYAVPVSDFASARASNSFGGEIVGSPAVSGDSVYAATTSGDVVRLDESLEVVDSTTVDEGVTASLSMVGGTLYVPTERTVRTLDPDLSPVDEIDTPAAASGAVTPSAGAGYVGTASGVFAIHELCDRSTVGSDTIRVPTDCATIASALSAVAPNGTVVVESGTYDESVTVSKPVTLRGEGATLDSSYGHEFAVVVAADDVVVDGLAIEQYGTAGIRVDAVEDVILRNITTDTSVSDIEVQPGGGTTSNVSIVDSDLYALTNVVVLNASNGGSITDVTVTGTTLESDVTDPTIRTAASSGGSVTGVTVRGSQFTESAAAVFEAGSNGHVADVTVRDVTFDSPFRVTHGFVLRAELGTGTATVENVTLADINLRGKYTTAVLVESTSVAEDGSAVVDGVTVRNTTLAPAYDGTGLAVRTDGNASLASPEVRNVVVSDTLVNGSATGVDIDTKGVGSIGPVDITDSEVVDNDVGLQVAEGNASDVSLTHSEVIGNADFGVVNNGTGLLNATYNDWGNESGPFDAAAPDTDPAPENPDGTGDAVSDGVLYRPWVSQTETSPTPTPTETPTESSPTETPTETPTESSPTETPTESSPTPTPTPTESSPTPTPTESSPTETPTETSPTPTPTPTESSPTPTSTETESSSDGDSSGTGPTGPTSGGSTGSTSGGSAGGSSSTSTPTPTPPSTSTVLFDDSSVESIVFDSPVSGNVSATDLDGLPAGMEEQPGTLLGVMRITVPPEYENTSATITFSVPTAALEEQGVAAEDVRLARYNDGWELLDTQVVERTDDSVTLSARTPGFSVFAAVAEQTETASPTPTVSPTANPTSDSSVTTSPTATPAPTASPTETEPAQMAGEGDDGSGLGMIPMLGAGGLLAAVVLVGLVLLRRRGDDDVEPSTRS